MKTNKRKLGQTHLFVPIRVIRGHNSFHGSNSFRTSNFGVCLRLAIRWWSRGVCLAFARISHRRSTRQIFERGQPPKAPHRRPRFREFIRLHQRLFPKSKRTVLLERSKPAKNAFIFKTRHRPLQRLFHIRASLMHKCSYVPQNRLGKITSLLYISTDARVDHRHNRYYTAKFPPIVNWPLVNCKLAEKLHSFPINNISITNLQFPILFSNNHLESRPFLVNRTDLHIDQPQRKRSLANHVFGDLGR